jgi:RimJ/RimL family protein N-acetyltransferase
MTLKISAAINKQALIGKRVRLEFISPIHSDFLAKIYKDDKFMDCYRLAQDRSISADQIRQRLENEQKLSPQELRCVDWVVVLQNNNDNSSEQKIGIASLADYQYSHNRAELLVGLNDIKYLNRGIGLEVSLLVIEYAFQQVKLHKIVSFVYSFNKIAQDITLKLGFVQEGLLRDHYYNHRDNNFIDLYQNGLLSADFYNNRNISRWSKRLLGRDISLPPSKVTVMSNSEIKKNFNSILDLIS